MPAVRRKQKRKRESRILRRRSSNSLRSISPKSIPTPEERAVPPKAMLKRLAHDPQQVDASIVYHVFHCSPCYKTCSGLLARLKASR